MEKEEFYPALPISVSRIFTLYHSLSGSVHCHVRYKDAYAMFTDLRNRTHFSCSEHKSMNFSSTPSSFFNATRLQFIPHPLSSPLQQATRTLVCITALHSLNHLIYCLMNSMTSRIMRRRAAHEYFGQTISVIGFRHSFAKESSRGLHECWFLKAGSP